MSWLISKALMNSLCSQELEAASLGENSSDGEQSALSNGNNTPQAYCAPDKMTGFSRLSRFGMTYKPLTENLGEELLTLYLEAFHAKTFQQQEKESELKESEVGCGEKWQGSFVKYDQDMCLWKTHQCSLLGDLELFSENWPQWGLMRDGECWEQQTLAQTIRGTESGFLLPTPDTVNRDNKKVLFNRNALSQSGRSLATYARTFPTPMASDNRDRGNMESASVKRRLAIGKQVSLGQSVSPISGRLNPMWVEWLMGFPTDHTALNASETPSSRKSQKSSGGQ